MSFLDLFISPALAQPAVGGASNPMMGLLLPLLFIGVMFFLMIRPQMKRQKEHRQLLSNLSRGDEVISSGGLAGRIEELGESFVTLEVADGVKVKLQKGAIAAVLPKGTLKSA